MSDTDQLAKLIENIMNPTSVDRKESEKLVTDSAKQNPDAFVMSLLDLLKNNYNEVIKSSACLWLQKAYSTYQSGLDDLYTKSSPQTRETFQREIFLLLASEENKNVRNRIADAIGDCAASLMTNEEIATTIGVTNDQIWPSLIQNVFDLYMTKEEKNILGSLRVMKNLFYYASDKMINYKDNILMVLNECMNNEVAQIRVYACEALGSLVTTLEPKHIKAFNPLAPVLIQIVKHLILVEKNEDLSDQVMNVLADICETEPRYLKKYFQEILNAMTEIRNCKEVSDGGIKDQAIEVVITISERYPEMLKKNSALLTQVVELIFTHMIDIDSEVMDEWASPPDGFNEDNEEEDDQKIIKFCMNCIDRLIAHVGSQFMLKFLSDCVAKMLTCDDWKNKNAALMALSQVGEYMENIEDVEPILQTIANHINHENPRIRYACLHCLGQLSDDMAPEFEVKYHEQVLPLFMSKVDDPVPRVLSHAFAGLTNFLEHCPEQEVLKVLDELYQKLIFHLTNGSSFVKENALAALSALSEGAGQNFLKYYDPTMNMMIEILKNATKNEYKQIRGQSIECVTIMSATMGIENFARFQDVIIQEMLNIQNSDISKEGDDPQKNYLLSGWQRISVILKEDFIRYIDDILPGLLEIIKRIIIDSDETMNNPEISEMKTANEGDDADIKGNTYADDEAEIALEMLTVFLNNMGSKLCNWFQRIWESIEPILCSWNDRVRSSSVKCLPILVRLLRESELKDNVPMFSRQIIAKLWKCMDDENDAEVLLDQGKAMQKIIEESGRLLNETELNDFYAKCLTHLQESDKRKQLTDTHKDEEDEDEPEIDQIIEEDKDKEDDFHVQIAEIIGALFKSHGEATIPIAKDLYDKFIITSLQPEMNHKMHKFGLFLICDICDHLGGFLTTDLIEIFFQALTKYAVDPVVFVRHAAIYGLGQLALRLGKNFAPLLDTTLNCLNSALSLPKLDEEKNVYLATNDNTVASFGKIIKAMSEFMAPEKTKQLIEFWLYKLPLIKDKEEGVPQHQMLTEIIINNPTIIIGEDCQNLSHVVNIFTKIYKKKSSNPQIDEQIKMIMTQFSKDEKIRNVLESINFDVDQKARITTIMSA